jgi:DNA-binding SARP family transcriptional activator/TolB-like protein
MSLRLRTLGAPRAFLDGVELADLPAQRLKFALLAYLAMERESPREAVLALFWPDRTGSRARHSLRQMLYELRQQLGEDWVEVRRDLIIARVETDAARFVEAADAGDADEALRLYDGAFLDGFSVDNHAFDAWVDRQRAHLGRLHRRLRRDRIAARLAADDADGAMAAARRWVELDPLEDEAAHALIECLALAGHRAAALQYYETYERQLAAELQVEPLDDTRALVERIRAGDPLVMGGATGLASRDDSPGEAPVAAESGAASDTAGSAASAARDPAGARPTTAAPLQPARRTGDPAPRRRPWLNRVPWPGWLAAALVPILVVAALSVGSRPESFASADAPQGTRIAILPFSDHSENGELVGLASALTEVLAQSLTRSRSLEIVSPMGVALLRERGTPGDSVGRLLSADFLVGGSLAVADGRVRVAVELMDGRTGSVVRHEVVERPWDDSRILVEDVVSRTAAFLRREVGSQIEVKRVRAQTSSEQAWRDVLEAKALQEGLPPLIRDREYDAVLRELVRADSLLARAATLDRRWAEPLLLRGWLLESRAFVSMAQAPADTTARRKLLEAGRSMADRAAERNPKDPRIHELRGTLHQHFARLPGTTADSMYARLAAAERELRRATELDAYMQTAWRRLAQVLFMSGRYAEAKFAAERAYRLDPLVREVNTLIMLLAASSLELGDDADSERWCLEGRRGFPDELPFLYCLAALHAWGDGIRADPAAVRSEIHRFERTHFKIQPELIARFETLVAAAYARAGQPDSARAIVARLDDAGTGSDAGLLWLRAGALAALGENAAAVRVLGTYVALGSGDSGRLVRSRAFWQLRGYPPYEQLLETVPQGGAVATAPS